MSASADAPADRIERVVSAIVTVVAMSQNTGSRTALELACDCGEGVELSATDPNREHVRALIEHVAFRHVTKRDVLLKRSSPVVTAAELGDILGG